ncbi:hypothetical protein [Aeromonas caviae]|uniref:hypothetical protein n=1 Tax=Aeromonas caviae TaxID=648 RepID=UPI0004DAB8D4|nr:hypothetical protein [Aeromonas caviae]KEP91367.1 hypothetical protein DA11_07640 [Aeromonas caviae]
MTVNEEQWFAEISPWCAPAILKQAARARVSLEGYGALGAGFLPWLGQSVSWARARGGSKSVKVLVIDDWFRRATEQFSVSLEKLKRGPAGPSSRPGRHSGQRQVWWPSVATRMIEHKKGPAGPFLLRTFCWEDLLQTGWVAR